MGNTLVLRIDGENGEHRLVPWIEDKSEDKPHLVHAQPQPQI